MPQPTITVVTTAYEGADFPRGRPVPRVMARVTVETRKAYFVVVAGKRKRFATAAAAYYKLCASLLGAKYLSAIAVVEDCAAAYQARCEARRAA